MTTYQDPPPQSRRAARQGERAHSHRAESTASQETSRGVASSSAEPGGYPSTPRTGATEFDAFAGRHGAAPSPSQPSASEPSSPPPSEQERPDGAFRVRDYRSGVRETGSDASAPAGDRPLTRRELRAREAARRAAEAASAPPEKRDAIDSLLRSGPVELPHLAEGTLAQTGVIPVRSRTDERRADERGAADERASTAAPEGAAAREAETQRTEARPAEPTPLIEPQKPQAPDQLDTAAWLAQFTEQAPVSAAPAPDVLVAPLRPAALADRADQDDEEDPLAAWSAPAPAPAAGAAVGTAAAPASVPATPRTSETERHGAERPQGEQPGATQPGTTQAGETPAVVAAAAPPTTSTRRSTFEIPRPETAQPEAQPPTAQRATGPSSRASRTGHWSATSEADELNDRFPVSRGMSSTGALTTNALVIPTNPTERSYTLSTGEVLVTGSIDLPKSLGATGAHPDRLDDSGIDHLLDPRDRELESTDSAPVRAVKAVSSHASTRDMIATPKRSAGHLHLWLAGAAVAMGGVVVALVVIAFATHAL